MGQRECARERGTKRLHCDGRDNADACAQQLQLLKNAHNLSSKGLFILLHINPLIYDHQRASFEKFTLSS